MGDEIEVSGPVLFRRLNGARFGNGDFSMLPTQDKTHLAAATYF